MTSARDIAEWFLQRAEEDCVAVDHLKLQKLCYYAQGFSLALLSEPMFDAPIQAWMHGPVVSELWPQFKEYGKRPIEAPAQGVEIEPWRVTVLEEVYQRFGWMTAWDLRNQTHTEEPWRAAWETPGENVEISHASMRGFFRKSLKTALVPPKPVPREEVLQRLAQDDRMREAVNRSRRALDSGQRIRWE